MPQSKYAGVRRDPSMGGSRHRNHGDSRQVQHGVPRHVSHESSLLGGSHLVQQRHQRPGGYQGKPPTIGDFSAGGARIGNFRRLVAAAGGSESISAYLGMPFSRVEELERGINFDDQVAFFIEDALHLHGFLDKLNAEIPGDFRSEERRVGKEC